jgi:putative ABC transport system permease protein
MTLSGFAASNLVRRPVRTLLTVMAIALAIGTAVALLALGRGIVEGVARGLEEHGAEFVVQPKSAADILSSRMPETMAKTLAAVPGVAEVAGELYAPAVSGDTHLLAAGWSSGAAAWANVPLREGRVPVPGERALLLGDVLAEALGVGVGGTVEIFDESFTVTGITRYASAINRSLAIMPLASLQEAALRTGQVSVFLVRLKGGLSQAEKEAVRYAMTAALPVVVSQTQEVLDQDGNLAILLAVSRAVSIIALAMGALSLFTTLLNSVQERTREIGMLAALGWSDGRIIGLIVIEGLFAGLAGCTLGVAAGLAASALFTSIPTIGNLISFVPRLSDLALPLALALPVCALGSTYPAWRAVRLSPAEALRSP